ncbi:hypothetical protein D915_004821 [Fasciola hepatica]|uniref:Uncharacterized protein n=1 Tax=Fasciola hepatica TaxID=6192 RepID=A0A2H1CCW7_FASHE|nr:hypothetical protein D915_004821 [Fasciola hepatica]
MLPLSFRLLLFQVYFFMLFATATLLQSTSTVYAGLCNELIEEGITQCGCNVSGLDKVKCWTCMTEYYDEDKLDKCGHLRTLIKSLKRKLNKASNTNEKK